MSKISYRELIDPNVSEITAHDVILLPDASIVVNFDMRPGLARIDAYFHHSLAPDETGGIWTWEAHGSAAAQNQRLIQFDEETGETLDVIDLIEEIILTNDRGHLRFVSPEDFRFKKDTEERPDGSITVFSNNSNRQQSEVLRLVPGAQDGVSVVPAESPFFSALMGKHEIAPNGNVLVISTWNGRVMEFALDGKLLRDYVNVPDENYSVQVSTPRVIESGYLTEDPAPRVGMAK